MIYKRLDEITAKLFFEILYTKNYNLISTEEVTTDEGLMICAKAWENLYIEYLDATQLSDAKQRRVFEVQADIEELKTLQELIPVCVRVLEFDRNKEVIEILKSQGYIIRENNYFNDIEQVKTDSTSLGIKIKRLLSKMPKRQIKDGEEEQPRNISKIIIGYAAGIGISCNVNTVTMEEFIAYQEIFNEKLKALKNGSGDNN